MERERKRELREQNARTWGGETEVFPVQKALDSNLRKNTAFIRRLRTSINPQSLNAFLQEVCTLSLQKYLSEIISACYEGLCKLKSPADIAVGVEVVSALHQRFGPAEFTGYLGWMIGRGLSTPDRNQLKALAQDVRDREEKDRVARQRVLLRVATELWLVGVLRSLEDVVAPEEVGKAREGAKVAEPTAKAKTAAKSDGDAEPFPLEVLKDLLGHDREHVNLPLVVTFVKTFSWDILGVQSAESRKSGGENGAAKENGEDGSATEADNDKPSDPPLIKPETRQLFKNILARYFDDVKNHVVRDQKNIVSQGRRNAEAYVRSGEVFEDRQANYEKQLKAQEKLVANAQVLADAIGTDMPDLKEKESSAGSGDGAIGLVKTGEYLRGQGDGAGIWEDEDERRFYESVVDLKDRVPGILLEDKKKGKDGEDASGKKPEAKEAEVEPEATEPKVGETDDASTAIANKSVGAQVDALLARLPEFSSKDSVDQVAMDFCFLNSRASRNRLIKAVEEIPKGRSDLLPFYSRLVATLGKYMPDISKALVSYLDDEFRSLQRRKSKDFLGQVRMQNVRYLAELTKFGVVPEHVIFHCLKVALDDFSRMNIEIMASLMENCGRYLLRNPETSPRMQSFLETLNRKKTAQHLGQQERMLIENAMYYVNPPERGAIEQKERSPVDMFIRKLIYLDLKRTSMDKITKLIRKLHWEDDEVVTVLYKVFTKPGKVKWINIELLASVLGALRKHHLDFVISVIDSLIESITFGLEINDFKFNQKRVAEVRYLGELYCEKVVDSRLVFDTLFKIVTYGHEGGVPKSGSINPLDLPDDFFRIRLVCTLLDVLGDLVEVFDRGPAKKKLDFFLTFLQYYIATKEDLPMDTDFLVQDTFYKLRPQWKLLTSLEEAGKAFAEVVKLNYQNAPGTAAEDEQEEESGTDDDNDETSLRNKEEADRSSGEEADENPNGVESPDLDTGDEEEEEEHIVVTRPEDERDPEIDADFDRELAKLMAESVESRKFERKPMFDVPLPMRKRVENNNGVLPEDTTNNNANSSTNNDQPAPISPLPSTMKFSLLSKKGNRQQTRSIDLPADSTFAVAMKSQQQAETEEKQRIKNLVLNYDLSSTSVDDDGEYDPLSLHPPPLQRNTNKERAAGLYDGHGKRGLEHRQRRRHSGGGKMVQPPQVRLQGNGGLKNPSMTLARHLHSPRQVGRGNEQHNKNNHPSPISTHNNPKQAETPIPSNKKSPAAPAVQAQVQDRQAFPSLSSATAELGKKTDNHKNTFAYDTVHDAAIEKQPQNPYNTPRIDKAGTSARMQRGRRLDLSDLDWT